MWISPSRPANEDSLRVFALVGALQPYTGTGIRWGAGSDAVVRRMEEATSILPVNIARDMEIYGRFEFSPQDAPPGAGDVVGQLLPKLYPIAQANPDAFTADLAAAVLPVGGWAVYGGQRCVRDLVGAHSRHPAYIAMAETAVAFLRSQGYGPVYLSEAELGAWRELNLYD